MSYLFIDKWVDFSELNDNSRGNVTNPILLLYASLLRAHSKKVFYVNANDNTITRNKLISFVEKEKIKTIIFYTHTDNINAILRLELSNIIKGVNLILLSINENLKNLTKKYSCKLIQFDERLSLENNFVTFLNALNIVVDFERVKRNIIDYSLEKDIRKKTNLISIGSGCRAKCCFCNIAGSELKYRQIDIIIKEITSLLDKGVNYFHLTNHSFSCEREFMYDFCMKLSDLARSYDFSWSCFVIPGFFINNIDLLPLMSKSNLKKIEIGCETGSEVLLSEMNIRHLNADIEKIIITSIAENIPVISAHFVLGTPKENIESLNETKDFILKLLDLTSASCDIHLHSYFPENAPYENIFDKIANKKNDFVSGSETLTIEELNEQKKQIYTAIRSKRKELKSKIDLQKQHELFILEKKYNIVTQIGRDIISKTSNYVLFEKKESFENAFFSWEIPNGRFDYSLLLNNFGFFVSQEKLSSDYSNFHEILDNYIRCGYTINEIIEHMGRESNGGLTKETVCSVLNQFENHLRLYYVKYLN